MKNVTFKTRHALVLSCISLMTCFAMLLGTTFAWFTDSVTSGVNRIVAGNLDVELYHNSTGSDATTAVQGAEDLFKVPVNGTATLWEPGAMAVETFKVKNAGNLALKYQLSLNKLAAADYNTVKWGTATKEYDLTDVIKVAVTDSRPADRTAAQALNYVSWDAFVNGAAKVGNLAPGADESFSVVLYWAPNANDVDNHYNLKNGEYDAASNKEGYKLSSGTELFINATVTLNATQYTSESDSFDNQYDLNADGVNSYTVSEYQTLAAATAANLTATNEAGDTITTLAVPAEVVDDLMGKGTTQLALEPVVTSTETTAETVTVSGSITPVNQDGKKVDLSGNTTDLTATYFVGKNLGDGAKITLKLYQDDGTDTVKATYKTESAGGASGEMTYNSTTGFVTFASATFCPLTVEFAKPEAKIGDTYYATLKEALDAAADSATVELLKDVDANSTASYIDIKKSLTLDGNGHSITGSGKRGNNNTTIAVNQNGDTMVDVTFKNLTVTNNESDGRPIELRGKINSCTLDGVTLNANGGGNPQGLTVGGSQEIAAKLVIKNSKINTLNSGYCIITFNPVDAAINNSEFTGYCALYLKRANSSAGSHGSIYNISNSIFSTPNSFTNESSSSFALIPFEDYGNTINIKDSTINISTTNTGHQTVVSFDNYYKDHYNNATAGNNVVNISDTTINMTGDNSYLSYSTVREGDKIIIDGKQVFPVVEE